MPTLFGTDGIRGVVDVDLTNELVKSIGRAAASTLATPEHSATILVGRDTRVSGSRLEAALVSGLLSGGANVSRCGILPTPAIAFLVLDEGANAGVVISASHNPPDYNGIKFFGSDGRKFAVSQEDEIEAHLDAVGTGASNADERLISDAESRYVAHALRALDGRDLKGLKVVVDCGFGAAFSTSPRALREAGAEVIALNDTPGGNRINVDCGSTNPEGVAKAVLEHSADAGFAHDGDADRVIAVDERGNVIDGDPILAILAIELKEESRLTGDAVVATLMANLGFRKAMASSGIKVIETPVGDRYVSEAMHKHGAAVGGEQSGHIVLSRYSTTGDGLITALRLLGRMASTGRTLGDLAEVVEKHPQVLLNVVVQEPRRVSTAERVSKVVKDAEARLGDNGRVLVRPSGTESLVRVMVEAPDDSTARSLAEEIAGVVIDELGGDAQGTTD